MLNALETAVESKNGQPPNLSKEDILEAYKRSLKASSKAELSGLPIKVGFCAMTKRVMSITTQYLLS